LIGARSCFDLAIAAVKWVRFAGTVFSRSVIMWHLSIAEFGMLNSEWGTDGLPIADFQLPMVD